MSLTTSEMTPADIAAVTGGNRNNGGMFGDGNGAWWIIVLFLFMFCGWGGMGWGGGFGNNGANSPGFQGYATRADINEGFAINGIDNGIRAIQNGLCDSTYAITNAVNSGFSAAELSRANQQAALMQQLFTMQMQQANCCCETREAIQGVNYNLATQACDTRNQMQQGFCAIQNTLNSNTRDVIDNQNANSRAILDFLTQDKIATLQAENTDLRRAASQERQSALLTTEMGRRLRRSSTRCVSLSPSLRIRCRTPTRAVAVTAALLTPVVAAKIA